jgi:hypothetical protein
MWEPQPLATLRASTASTGITLPYFTGNRNQSVNNIYSQNDMKHINTLCGQNTEFLTLKEMVSLVTTFSYRDNVVPALN